MRLTTWLIVPFLATAFGQSGPPRMGAVEVHEINSLFLSHLEAQARHAQPSQKTAVKVPVSLPPSRPAITGGPLTDDELLAIRPMLAAARTAIQVAEVSILAEKPLPNGKVPPGQSARIDQLQAARKAAIEDAMRKLQAALTAASWAKVGSHIDNEFYKGVPRVAATPGK